MKNSFSRILILSSVLFCALFVSCGSEGAGEKRDERSEDSLKDSALLAALEMPAMRPDRAEVLLYDSVMFSSKDSADIYQLAHMISQVEKDSVKACLNRVQTLAKEDHKKRIIRESTYEAMCVDAIHINLYRGDELKEKILFKNEPPYALKEFLDKKGVAMDSLRFAPDTSREKTVDDLIDRVKSLPDSQFLTGGQWVGCRSVIRTPDLSDMKTSPAVDDSVKLKIKKVLAQRTPSIRHLWNKHVKKLQKQFPWEEFPEELHVSMTLNQGGGVDELKARFAEPPQKISDGRQKIYDNYLKDVEESMRRWKYPPTSLKNLRLEFSFYPF